MKIEIDSKELEGYLKEIDWVEPEVFNLLNFLKFKMQPTFKVGDIWKNKKGDDIIIISIINKKFKSIYPVIGTPYCTRALGCISFTETGKYDIDEDSFRDLIEKVGELDE